MITYRILVGYMQLGIPHTAEYLCTARSPVEAKREARAQFESTHEPGIVIATMRCSWAIGRKVKKQESALTY